MLHSTDYRELGNGKCYQTSDERIMNQGGSTEEIAKRIILENFKGEVPGFQKLTQDAVSEHIGGFIAPPTSQMEELTRLVQRKTTSWRPNPYPRTDLGTISGTAMP